MAAMTRAGYLNKYLDFLLEQMNDEEPETDDNDDNNDETEYDDSGKMKSNGLPRLNDLKKAKKKP